MKAVTSTQLESVDTTGDQLVVSTDNSHPTSDAIIDSSEELGDKMTRTMTSNECTNSDDVCHSLEPECDQSMPMPSEDVGYAVQCDSATNEISSSGITSSCNKEVDSYCEVIVTTNTSDPTAVTSVSAEPEPQPEAEPELNGDINGDSSGDNDNKVSCSAFAIVAHTHNCLTNDSSALNTTNLGLNKKKFGKFKFLNDEQSRSADETCDVSAIHSEETSLDSKFDDKPVINESSSHDNSENSDSSKTDPSPHKSNKRRGRPARSNKKMNPSHLSPQLSLEEEDLSRRRSSRLKTLEARKEQERAVYGRQRDLEESSQDSNPVLNSDANESSKGDKRKKKKSKKDKNKSNESKKKKRKRKVLSLSEQSKQNCDAHSNDYFATPLPPSHSNIKSNCVSNAMHRNSNAEDDSSPKPEKVKSRWRRNSELECGHGVNGEKPSAQTVAIIIPKETEPPPPFDAIDDNIYLFERRKSKSKKETRRMVCDCILTKEERARNLIGCGEDCLNRMLMIECGSRCSLGDHCANKRFQKKHYAKVEPFRTSSKGWGLRTLEPLQPNTFIMEYVGEVIDPLDFHNRTQKYSKEKREHHYFMALKSDEIIDATVKGNITRFVNHSCDPNSETQKWTINGELRIGFFTQRFVQAGEEITFDYQFQRYGKEAQKCFCESLNCRGFIGASESANILTDGSKITATNKLEDDEEEEELLEDLALEEEIAKLAESGGLRNRQQVLMLARLMVRAEDKVSRLKLVDIIKGTAEIAYLRLLIDYHGLQLIWSWMMEADDNELKAGIMEVLGILPIPNKTMLTDSKVYSVVERWSQKAEEEPCLQTEKKEETVVSSLELDTQNKENELVQKDISKVEENEIKTEEKVTLDKEQEAEAVESTSKLEEEEKEQSEERAEEKMEVSDEVPSTTAATESAEEAAPVATDVKVEDQIPKSPPQDKQDSTEPEKSNNKSSPRIEMRSPSLSLVIKPRSVPNTPQKETPSPVIINQVKPSIASMAQKLLLNWKELKEVFRIPRLERQKRYEDEKEADRKTKEVEDRRAKGLPVVYDRRGVDDRDYTIAGILGIKRKGLKRTNDSKDAGNKRNANVMTQQLSSNWNKVSKEEHRKMFEMEVAQKDYQEALKRYHQELAYYNAVYGQQIQAQQQQQQMYPQESVVTEQPYSYEQYYQNNQIYSHSNYDNYSVANETQYYASEEVQQPIDALEDNGVVVDENIELFGIETGPALITLTNCEETTQTESSLAIDNLPHDWVAYSDGQSSKQSPDSQTIFDSVYPPPGVFYKTPDGQTFFTPLPIDRNEKAINLVFSKDITIPLDTEVTKTITSSPLPDNWSHSSDKKGNIYYYHKLLRKCQWVAPKVEKMATPDHQSDNSNNDNKISDNEDSIPASEVIAKIASPKVTAEETDVDEPMESCIDSIAADSVTVNPEPENPINSTHSPTNLLQSILALEADPRKRRHLLNSVMPSTTTAAADTSSSSSRRKFTSTRQIQEHFRNKMSEYVVHCLNPYRRTDCKKGRILNNNDFKSLARKLTHTIMGKEIKQCKSVEHLSCNDAVKHKTKDYVKKYMARFGPFYKTDTDRNASPKEHIVANDSND